jgi:hypothetical protein
MPGPALASARLVCPEDEEHSAYWANVLMTKPPLATLTQSVAKKGYALKRGPSNRNFMNWKRVFIVLHYPFLSYFASNDPQARCEGIVYLPGMTHDHLKHYPSVRNVLKICPRVRRNLHHVATSDDDDNFYFSFEREDELTEWVNKFKEEALRAENSEHFLCSDDDDDTKALKIRINDKTGAALLRDRDTDGGQTDVVSELNETLTDASLSLAMRSQADSAARRTQRDPHSLSDLKRKSFFASSEVAKCHNSDVVHHHHCVSCKMAPIYGFMYTDVSKENVNLCGNCFREGDFDPRQLFLVSPDVEGECLRLQPSIEGSSKTFRAVELVVLESMFRVIGGDMDGALTKPISKRRMISFWRNSGVDEHLSITEKDLLTLCRHHSTIAFEEFVFLVRCRLNLTSAVAAAVEKPEESPPSSGLPMAAHWPSLSPVAAAVERLAAMLRAAQRGRDIVAYRAAMQELRADASNRAFSLLERAALNVLVSSVAFDVPELGAVVPVQLLELIFERLVMLAEELTAGGASPSAVQQLCSGFSAYTVHELDADLAVSASGSALITGNNKNCGQRVVPVSDVEGAVEFEWIRMGLDKQHTDRGGDGNRTALLANSHRLCDVLENVLCYELGQGLGFYTQQPETIHALGCNICGSLPIVGFAFKCTVCLDYDLCLRCFQEVPHERHHTFTRFPGGAVLAAPKMRIPVGGGSVQSAGTAAVRSTLSAAAGGASNADFPEVKSLRKVGFLVS